MLILALSPTTMPVYVADPSFWGDLPTWLAAIGTIAVSLLAIFHNKVLSWFGPKMRLVILDPRKHKPVPRDSGIMAWYFHLDVMNRRRRPSATSCEITLRRIQRRGANGDFEDVAVPMTMQFLWSDPDNTPRRPSVGIGRTLDLCWVDENSKVLTPALYSVPNHFDGFIHPDQCLRYHLDIEANNFTSKKSQSFEIAWNGKWSENSDRMAENVTITEIKE